VRDAHSLYVETLAELGPVGLAMLVALLAVPLFAVRRARWHPLMPSAVGAYVAYLVHAGVDWDWELPAVTLVGLTCASAILLAGRRSTSALPLAPTIRWTGVAALVAVAVLAGIGLMGNTALSRSESARKHGEFATAVTQARHARSWMHWSPKPLLALGRAELGAGLRTDARASFRKAVSMDRTDWQLWYYLARASKAAAQRRALEQARQLSPRSSLIAAAVRAQAAKP
jgi:hypothetical protein